jgi:hypothetical protein
LLIRWFGANSELNGILENNIPDILMFGGIATSKEFITQKQKGEKMNKSILIIIIAVSVIG